MWRAAVWGAIAAQSVAFNNTCEMATARNGNNSNNATPGVDDVKTDVVSKPRDDCQHRNFVASKHRESPGICCAMNLTYRTRCRIVRLLPQGSLLVSPSIG